MAEELTCPACNIKWSGESHDLDDLCPQCLYELIKDSTSIILGKHDAAIILRSEDGTEFTKEFAFAHNGSDEDPTSNVTMTTALISLGLDSPEIMDKCWERFEDGLKAIEAELEKAKDEEKTG